MPVAESRKGKSRAITMGTVRYTTVNGEVIAQKRDGVRKQYIPDALGSTVAMLDSTQTITDTFSYWPYGEVVSRTGTTETPFQYVGTRGYYKRGLDDAYVRTRHLQTNSGRWTTQDTIGLWGLDANLYRYCMNVPLSFSDPNGTDILGGFVLGCLSGGILGGVLSGLQGGACEGVCNGIGGCIVGGIVGALITTIPAPIVAGCVGGAISGGFGSLVGPVCDAICKKSCSVQPPNIPCLIGTTLLSTIIGCVGGKYGDKRHVQIHLIISIPGIQASLDSLCHTKL